MHQAIIGLLLQLAVVTVAAAQELPPYVSLPPGATHNTEAFILEDYGEAEFDVPRQDDPVVQRGKHWYAELRMSSHDDEIEQRNVWPRMKPTFLKRGWTVLFEKDANPYAATLRYQKDGKDVWGAIKIFAAPDIRLDVIEIGEQNMHLTLRPPAAGSERISAAAGDFPFLSPLPGSTFSSSDYDPRPLVLEVEQSREPLAVDGGATNKFYAPPPRLSNLQFALVYREALIDAGWKIVAESHAVVQNDAVLVAHYTTDGRDLWAYLHNGEEEYSLHVADAGARDLKEELEKRCRVPIYGIHFDPNKATLLPDSQTTLERVRQLLADTPDLKLEIQGHTDDVGGEDRILKLSEARALAVKTWLTQHKIAAKRLTAKGYGKTRPITTNESRQGRARNRRIELVTTQCERS